MLNLNISKVFIILGIYLKEVCVRRYVYYVFSSVFVVGIEFVDVLVVGGDRYCVLFLCGVYWDLGFRFVGLL